MIIEITNKFAEKMEQKGLHSVGFGGGQDKNKINFIKIAFQVGKNLDVTSARELSVEITNEFLIFINGNEEFRPHLSELPFKPKNATITICGKSPSDVAQIECVSAAEGKIYYRRENAEGLYSTIHEETFEEAERILAGR